MSDRFAWLGDLAPYLPYGIGAAIGLRWAKDQTPTQRVVSFGLSFGLAIYIAPALAEVIGLGPKGTVAVGILTAVVGMDVLGGLVAAGKAFQNAPLDSFKSWWNVFWKRDGSS